MQPCIAEEEIDEPISACTEYDPNCQDCVLQRKEANIGDVHESVREVFKRAIEKMDLGYYRWIHENKILRYPTVICHTVLKVEYY